MVTSTINLEEKAKQFHARVKKEIYTLVREEDKPVYDTFSPPQQYPTIVRHIWWSVFDPKIPKIERSDHLKVTRNIMEIYGETDRATFMKFADPQGKLGYTAIEKMLEQIPDERQILVPIMTGGIVPGAFVYDYMKRNDLLIDVAFVGHSRKQSIEPNFYKENTIYMSDE